MNEYESDYLPFSSEYLDKCTALLEDFLSCEEGFRKAVLKDICYSLEKNMPVLEIHWGKTSDIISYEYDREQAQLFNIIECCFRQECLGKEEVTANALSFWEHIFCEEKQFFSCCSIKNFHAILYGMMGYGDFFRFNSIQHLPETMILSDDTMPKEQEQVAEESLIIQERKLHNFSKQRLMSLNQTEDFISVLSAHKQQSQRLFSHLEKLTELKNELKKNKKDPKNQSGYPPEIVESIFHIFAQYVELLDTIANVKSAQKELIAKIQDSEGILDIKYNIKCILSLIWQSEDRIELLPAYLTAIFQKQKMKMRSTNTTVFDNLDSFINQELFQKIKSEDNRKFKSATNTSAPEEYRTMLYQLLCIYFKSCSNVSFNQEHCDILIQATCKSFGQPFYKISEECVKQIALEGKRFGASTFEESDKWVHPVLEEIYPRIEHQFRFKPGRLPKIIESSYLHPDNDILGKLGDLLKKNPDVAEGFYSQYKTLLFLGDHKLSRKEISAEGLDELASIMDNIMKKANITLPTNNEKELARILDTVQLELHTFCVEKIQEEYYCKCMSFLLKYLYSSAFILSDVDFTSNNYWKVHLSTTHT